jgi:hypothetical protein
MFINFYSIGGNFEKDNKTIFLTGYSNYVSKYFHIKIQRCTDRNYVINCCSDEQHLIVKHNRTFYCLSTEFFDKLIEPSTCVNFNYIKHNIPVNVYITMMGLLSVNL